jgi:hypothetical protein
MVKLTVIYTLPEGADHEAFLQWRTTEHQKENMGIPGVIRSDFYAIREMYSHEPDTPGHGGGDGKAGGGGTLKSDPLTFRYMTEAYWPDMDSFRAAFFDSGYQEALMESLKKIARPLFFVSEEVMSEEN